MCRSQLAIALIAVLLGTTLSCSSLPKSAAAPNTTSMAALVVSPKSKTETPISPLLQNISALNFVAGETTIGELNRSLGNPSSQNEDWAGVKEYNYSNLQAYGFSSLTAFVDPKHGDAIKEILLGSDLGNRDLLSQLGNPATMMMIIPTEHDDQAHYVPDVINVILFYPQQGLFVQIACNSINPSDCQRLTGEGYGGLYLIGKNLPVEALKKRLLQNCPECSVIELPWEGFANQ